MQEWVKLFKSGNFTVCVEIGNEGPYPAIIFRMFKDGGILRSVMAIPVESPEEAKIAQLCRNNMFKDLDQELVDAAVASMLEMEPTVMDGNRHAFMMDLDGE